MHASSSRQPSYYRGPPLPVVTPRVGMPSVAQRSPSTRSTGTGWRTRAREPTVVDTRLRDPAGAGRPLPGSAAKGPRRRGCRTGTAGPRRGRRTPGRAGGASPATRRGRRRPRRQCGVAASAAAGGAEALAWPGPAWHVSPLWPTEPARSRFPSRRPASRTEPPGQCSIRKILDHLGLSTPPGHARLPGRGAGSVLSVRPGEMGRAAAGRTRFSRRPRHGPRKLT